MYSGVVESGSQVINATKGKKERLGKLFQMHSNKENPVEKASAGHIYAVIGLGTPPPVTPSATPTTRSCWSR